MSCFKVGDKVRCINSQTANGEQIYAGYVGTITHVASDGTIAVDNMFGHKGNAVCCPEAFEKIKEEPNQMKATDKISVEITLAELAKIYAIMGECCGSTPNTLWNYACDLFDPDQLKRQDFLEDKTSEEILSFGSYEDEFLALIFNNKSPQQIKIEELQATIDKACKELKELREMEENK